ncbi:MAG: homoserine kinase [Steroidobacteraceae bacterium]
MAFTSATAFAPATVGNVGVGFDILGHSFAVLGDHVRAERIATPRVRITSITGTMAPLPQEAALNTAGKAVLSLCEDESLPFGIDLSIHKGIPLGSGLGGSAASAAAAVVAANELLERPLPPLELLKHAIAGEAVASGSRHADNIAPALFGGLVLTVGIDHPRIKQIPVPPSIRCVLLHPRMFLSTQHARGILTQLVDLSDVVWQTANLAGFLAGCYTNDLALIREAFEDVLIEPQRAKLIPGFGAVKRATLEAGALGCSISGSGPSVFAWCEEDSTIVIRDAMLQAFGAHGLVCDHWIAPIGSDGACIVERE